MKISQHIAAGVAGSVPLYWLTGSGETTLAFILSNSLIDIDHFFDYWHDHGFHLSWKKFYQACTRADFIHFIVVLHSFEILFLVGLILFLSRETVFYSYILGILAGFSFHLAFDMAANKGIKVRYYWLFNRYRKKFKIDDIGNPELLYQKRKRVF